MERRNGDHLCLPLEKPLTTSACKKNNIYWFWHSISWDKRFIAHNLLCRTYVIACSKAKQMCNAQLRSSGKKNYSLTKNKSLIKYFFQDYGEQAELMLYP